MKLGVLFSGGKDSCYACFLARKRGYELACLVSIISENKESFMFHTPNIELVKKQAKVMDIPLIIDKTAGKKEDELRDLEKAIKKAIKKYKIDGIVTGAIESVYQSSRIQKICNKLKIECFNPLWQKNAEEYLNEIIKNKFEVVVSGVFAGDLENFLGRKIDEKFIYDIKNVWEKYKINIAGEGGEYESFVLDCPLFKKKLVIKSFKISGDKNSKTMRIELK